MKEAVVETGHMGRKVQDGPTDGVIAELAERQHGVVALRQLEALGLSATVVHKRAARGSLHRVHRGVYAVGRPGLNANGRRTAAVLAYGRDAVLSHRSAAGLWGLRPDNRPNVEVSVPRPGIRARPGIDLHRVGRLTEEDVTVLDGIPCTTVARTLVDLGDVANRRVVEQAVEQAEVLRLFDLRAVEDVMRRVGKARGSPTAHPPGSTSSGAPHGSRSKSTATPFTARDSRASATPAGTSFCGSPVMSR